MRPRFSAVFVLCPPHASGGPDALHQLVSTLNELGARAFISYLPPADAVTAALRERYAVAPALPVDAADNLIVIPEMMTGQARAFAKARTAIWWLSVDHFVGYAGRGEHVLRRRLLLHDLRSLLRLPTSRLTWPEMRGLDHYTPTAYAKAFLHRHGIASVPLRDPVNDSFLSVAPASMRRDAVAFSPQKGMDYTAQVLDALAGVPAIALQGLSRAQLIEVLRQTKVYLDFGYFPGADRMPREALLCGACIVIGRRGAAANPHDHPIPDAYKIDHTARDFAARAREAVLRIFGDFETCSRDFDPFRTALRAGPAIFAQDVRDIFFAPD
jgi:hypothetical protein